MYATKNSLQRNENHKPSELFTIWLTYIAIKQVHDHQII